LSREGRGVVASCLSIKGPAFSSYRRDRRRGVIVRKRKKTPEAHLCCPRGKSPRLAGLGKVVGPLIGPRESRIDFPMKRGGRKRGQHHSPRRGGRCCSNYRTWLPRGKKKNTLDLVREGKKFDQHVIGFNEEVNISEPKAESEGGGPMALT